MQPGPVRMTARPCPGPGITLRWSRSAEKANETRPPAMRRRYMKDSLFHSLRLRDRIGLAAVVATGVIFVILRFGEFPVGAGMDDAYYIEMARSLAEGRGPVIQLNGTGPGWAPSIFPLGFPLLLSPFAMLAPTSVQIFKLVPMLALAGLVPICLLLARFTSAGNRQALTALVCLNPWTIGYASGCSAICPLPSSPWRPSCCSSNRPTFPGSGGPGLPSW